MKRFLATLLLAALIAGAQEPPKPSTALSLTEPEAMKGELFQTRIEKIDMEVQLLQVRFRQLQEDRQAAVRELGEHQVAVLKAHDAKEPPTSFTFDWKGKKVQPAPQAATTVR